MSYLGSTSTGAPENARSLDDDVPSGGAGRFACPLCGDRFRRLEHMYRHKVGSHTNNRPFTCQSCGRKFARSDSLARHNAIHQTSSSPQKVTPSPRVAKACSFCAKQRLRCDGKETCGRCAARGLQCVYLPRAKRRTSSVKWPASADPSSTTAVPGSPTYEETRGTTSSGSDGLATDTGGAWESDKALLDYRAALTRHAGEEGDEDEIQNHHAIDQERARYNSILQISSSLGAADFSQPNGHPTPVSARPLDPQRFVPQGTVPLTDLHGYGVLPEEAAAPGMVPMHPHQDISRPMPVTMDEAPPFFNEFDAQFSIWDWMASDFWRMDPAAMLPTPVDSTGSAGLDPQPVPGVLNTAEENHQAALGPHDEGGWATPGVPAPTNPQWPTEWNPTKQDNLIRFPDMTNVPPEILEAEDFAHVEPMAPACYEKISMAMEQHANGHGPFRTFSNANMASIEVFSVFVQLFWEYFAPTFPILHHGTFNSGEAGWQLVLATATIGCRFSKLPGAIQYALGLQELLRRVIAGSVEKDNSQARELWFAQCIVLGNVGMIYAGTKRFFEIGEIGRNTLVTVSRRNGSLTSTVTLDKIRRENPDADTEQLWRLWAKEEMRRRLGFAVYVLDSNTSLYFGLNPCMGVHEIKQSLPVSEGVWNASTAPEWISQCQFIGETPTVQAAIRMAQRGAPVPQSIGYFGHLIVVLTTYRHAIHIRDMALQNPLFASPNDVDTNPVTISELSGSAVSVLESFQSTVGFDQHPQTEMTGSAVECRRLLVLMLLHVPQTDLVRFAATFDTWDRLPKDHGRLVLWVREDDGRTARTAVAYAGGLLARIRQKSDYSAFDDAPSALAATLVLWTYNKLLQHLNLDESPSDGASSARAAVVRLDTTGRWGMGLTADVRAWRDGQAGMRPCLQGVGDISRHGAASRILESGIDMLSRLGHRWTLCQGLVAWLTSLRARCSTSPRS